MEYVTMRKQNRLQRTKSDTNINTSLSFEETLPDSSQSNSDQLNLSARSLPTDSHNYTSQFQEMKQQINELRMELAGAHEEIASLNCECENLKRKLKENENQLYLFKQITSEPVTCTPVSTPTNRTPTLKKLTQIRTRISRFSALNSPKVNSCTETPKSHKTSTSFSIGRKLYPGKQDTVDKNTSKWQLPTIIPSNCERETKPDTYKQESRKKIYVIGDEHARNLAITMRQDRQNKWNDTYEIFGLVKPGATSCEFLKTCESLYKILNKNDCVILAIGGCDKNPSLFMSNLCNMMNCLRNHNVFIVSVQCNQYLNEFKMNNEIYLLVNHYKKCKFIQYNDYELFLNDIHAYTRHLSFKLSVEIDFLTYHCKYLTFKNKHNINNTNIPRKCVYSNRISSIPQIPVNCKKGTIPYYFKPIKSSITPSNEYSNNIYKKGTIPYLFFRMKTNKTNNSVTTAQPSCSQVLYHGSNSKQKFFRP